MSATRVRRSLERARRAEVLPAAGGDRPDDAVLALQRAAGNVAVASLLARRPAPGQPDSVEFRVGTEIGAKLAEAAKKVASGGVTVDEVKGLRAVALANETIDHEERGFLAGLLDSANASLVAGGGNHFVFTKASIDAHLADVADLDRPLLDSAVASAVGDKWKALVTGDDVDQPMQAEAAASLVQMKRLVGKAREPQLNSVLTFAAAHGVQPAILLTAMLSGSSDSTAGDMLMAATVYVVAAAVKHPVATELLGGVIKVDQVPKAQLGVADAQYSAEGIGKDKGDTLYVPESLSVDNAADRSQIIHELEHASQDRVATAGLIRVQAEVGAYRAQAAYLLQQIAPLQGDERDAAVKQAAAITNAILIRALILESRTDKEFELVIVDINAQMPSKTQLGVGDLVAFIATDDATLLIETQDEIMRTYTIGAGDLGPGGGFRGSHDTSQM